MIAVRRGNFVVAELPRLWVGWGRWEDRVQATVCGFWVTDEQRVRVTRLMFGLEDMFRSLSPAMQVYRGKVESKVTKTGSEMWSGTVGVYAGETVLDRVEAALERVREDTHAA